GAVDELRVAQCGHARDVDAAPLAGRHPGRARSPGAAAAPGQPPLPERWGADDADLHLAVALDAQQRAEEGHAADEVVGAVDGVDVPAHGRPDSLLALLFADQAVVRVGSQDAL